MSENKNDGSTGDTLAVVVAELGANTASGGIGAFFGLYLSISETNSGLEFTTNFPLILVLFATAFVLFTYGRQRLKNE